MLSEMTTNHFSKGYSIVSLHDYCSHHHHHHVFAILVEISCILMPKCIKLHKLLYGSLSSLEGSIIMAECKCEHMLLKGTLFLPEMKLLPVGCWPGEIYNDKLVLRPDVKPRPDENSLKLLLHVRWNFNWIQIDFFLANYHLNPCWININILTFF